MKRGCLNCRFYHEDTRQFISQCRYNPPSVHVEQHQHGASITTSHWPYVGKYEWCGKHQKLTRDQQVEQAARILTEG